MLKHLRLKNHFAWGPLTNKKLFQKKLNSIGKQKTSTKYWFLDKEKGKKKFSASWLFGKRRSSKRYFIRKNDNITLFFVVIFFIRQPIKSDKYGCQQKIKYFWLRISWIQYLRKSATFFLKEHSYFYEVFIQKYLKKTCSKLKMLRQK